MPPKSKSKRKGQAGKKERKSKRPKLSKQEEEQKLSIRDALFPYCSKQYHQGLMNKIGPLEKLEEKRKSLIDRLSQPYYDSSVCEGEPKSELCKQLQHDFYNEPLINKLKELVSEGRDDAENLKLLLERMISSGKDLNVPLIRRQQLSPLSAALLILYLRTKDKKEIEGYLSDSEIDVPSFPSKICENKQAPATGTLWTPDRKETRHELEQHVENFIKQRQNVWNKVYGVKERQPQEQRLKLSFRSGASSQTQRPASNLAPAPPHAPSALDSKPNIPPPPRHAPPPSAEPPTALQTSTSEVPTQPPASQSMPPTVSQPSDIPATMPSSSPPRAPTTQARQQQVLVEKHTAYERKEPVHFLNFDNNSEIQAGTCDNDDKDFKRFHMNDKLTTLPQGGQFVCTEAVLGKLRSPIKFVFKSEDEDEEEQVCEIPVDQPHIFGLYRRNDTNPWSVYAIRKPSEKTKEECKTKYEEFKDFVKQFDDLSTQ